VNIITITLNPAIDRTIFLDRPLSSNGVHRAINVVEHGGGKGINVSRTLKMLGMDSIAVYFAGGETGKRLKQQLQNENIQSIIVPTQSPTRTNIKVIGSDGKCAEFNELGGPISEEELTKMIQKIEVLAKSPRKPQLFVISGSIPQGVEKAVYNFLIRLLKDTGNMTALDCDGENLHNAICTGPDIIKPNLAELESILGTKISTTEQAVEKCRQLYVDTGIEVLCTMGGNGAVYAGSDGFYTAEFPHVGEKGTGAGDTFLAAFLYERTVTGDVSAALKFASGAATAKVATPGTAIPEVAEMRKYAERVGIKKV